MVKRNPPDEMKRGSKMRRGGGMRKMGSGVLDKKMEIPGMGLFSHLISGSTPIKEGMYVIYYEHLPEVADSRVKKSAAIGIANFSAGAWGSNKRILAYIGPIPVLSLPPLLECSPPYKINQVFYTGTLEQAAHDCYESGPHALHILAYLQPQMKGHFIFCRDSEELKPYPIGKAVVKEDDQKDWKTLSDKAIKKYSKMIQSLVK